tara:strand:- start:1218 stop:1673 length:456 start_codon:yes stop_codon:yes gene_type:complete
LGNCPKTLKTVRFSATGLGASTDNMRSNPGRHEQSSIIWLSSSFLSQSRLSCAVGFEISNLRQNSHLLQGHEATSSKVKRGGSNARTKTYPASAKNAITAATAAGLKPTATVVLPDGSLRLEFITEQLDNAANSKSSSPLKGAPKKWGEQR